MLLLNIVSLFSCKKKKEGKFIIWLWPETDIREVAHDWKEEIDVVCSSICPGLENWSPSHCFLDSHLRVLPNYYFLTENHPAPFMKLYKDSELSSMFKPPVLFLSHLLVVSLPKELFWGGKGDKSFMGVFWWMTQELSIWKGSKLNCIST